MGEIKVDQLLAPGGINEDGSRLPWTLAVSLFSATERLNGQLSALIYQMSFKKKKNPTKQEALLSLSVIDLFFKNTREGRQFTVRPLWIPGEAVCIYFLFIQRHRVTKEICLSMSS